MIAVATSAFVTRLRMCRDEARYESLKLQRPASKSSRDLVDVDRESAHLTPSNHVSRAWIDVVWIGRAALAGEGPRAEEKAKSFGSEGVLHSVHR